MFVGMVLCLVCLWLKIYFPSLSSKLIVSIFKLPLQVWRFVLLDQDLCFLKKIYSPFQLNCKPSRLIELVCCFSLLLDSGYLDALRTFLMISLSICSVKSDFVISCYVWDSFLEARYSYLNLLHIFVFLERNYAKMPVGRIDI